MEKGIGMSLPVEIDTRRGVIAEEIGKLGAELIEIQFRRVGQKSTLTFVVDKDGGINLDECVRVNRALGAFFDSLEDVMIGSYYLEVNSPGLDRPLKDRRDFNRASGQRLRVTWRDETGRVLTDVGRLLLAQEEGFDLSVEPSSKTKTIAYAAVLKAVREISFKR